MDKLADGLQKLNEDDQVEHHGTEIAPSRLGRENNMRSQMINGRLD